MDRDGFGAAEAYSSAISTAVGNARVLRQLLCDRAAAYIKLSRYRDGLEDATKALELDAKRPKAYTLRAQCYVGLGDSGWAARDLERSLALDPANESVSNELRNVRAAHLRDVANETDFYYVLGVAKVSEEKDIKKRFRELSLRWHPDKWAALPSDHRDNAARKFKLIKDAYDTLSDAAKRRAYDAKQDREATLRRSTQAGQARGPSRS